ncbi:hypothetical protein HMPREF3213_02233 [Heyndrickxia coagulans]|uniref:Uncharacterized protein n=1 Tax=Heyndrickxia coagulans TaxID=1398 RepID=A0A0C5C6X7_HEYCO|nr:hypothetical protein SB48_HM08orf05274 [Heyndrickxia coagulans]KWZ80729.1 hypothetical protein HMPREF3213_02233 [Heyndrickxia coagulans]
MQPFFFHIIIVTKEQSSSLQKRYNSNNAGSLSIPAGTGCLKK